MELQWDTDCADGVENLWYRIVTVIGPDPGDHARFAVSISLEQAQELDSFFQVEQEQGNNTVRSSLLTSR